MGAAAAAATLERARGLLRNRELPAAIALLEDLLREEPAHPQASFLVAAAHAELRQFERARERLAASFAEAPRQPAPHHLLFANVLLDSAAPVEAETHARAALEATPGLAPAWHALGLALRAQGREEEAIAAFRAALASPTPQRGAHRPLARLLHRRANVVEAIEHYRAALAHDDRDPDAWNELGVALTDAGELDAARAAYREALARKPDYAQVESNLLINLHYDPTVDAERMYAAHRGWAARHASGLQTLTPGSSPKGEGSAGKAPPRGDGRLRVGFLSPAFTAGPTATFVQAVLDHLDRTAFEPVGYNVGRCDATSESLRQRCIAWHELWNASDEDVAQRIAADGLDVLVDLAGHTPGGRPRVLARKPARRIVTWLDYFDTTGLDTVDAILTDPVSTPVDGPQRFTERVVRLEACRLCYTPPAHAPAVVPPPMARGNPATFGCFNRYSKLAPPVLDAWARVLKAVPGSRLLVKNNAFGDAMLRARFTNAMAARGVGAERLDLRGPSPHAAMLAEYGDMDVALDAFPYNGGLTTCEALWMGVPVVTILGSAMISRQSAAMLAAAGHAAWSAPDDDRYVEIARSLAADPPALAAIRAGMREALRTSALLDGARFTRGFEAALRSIVTA